MIDKIRKKIQQAIPDAEVHSHDPDGRHFEAIVVSSVFEGMPLLKQHQLVLNALKEEMVADVVHALSLKTYTPEKWKERQLNS
jgi:acid stress-induced BolA-like protein IbaG/YrbA